MSDDIFKKINDAGTQEELLTIMRANPPGGTVYLRAEERLRELRHYEIRPRPWYKTGLGWIAFLTLVAAIAAVAIGILQLIR